MANPATKTPLKKPTGNIPRQGFTPPGMPELTIEETPDLPDGDYEGIIMDVRYERRGAEQFPYVDIVVKEKESGIELKAGYPANKITPASALGRLLERFGADVTPGKTPDFNVIRPSTLVTFTVGHETTERGVFVRIKADSVNPQ